MSNDRKTISLSTESLLSSSLFARRPPTELELEREKVRQLEGYLNQLKEQPTQVGTVIGETENTIVIAGNVGRIEIKRPPGDFGRQFKVGVRVNMHPSGTITGVHTATLVCGPATPVNAYVGEERVQVTHPQFGDVVVHVGQHKPKVGDSVLVDASGSVVADVVSKDSRSSYAFKGETNVRWEDVVGQEQAVRAMREMVEGPLMNADKYRRYGRKGPKGVLLAGPPGVGKTMIGKAAATAVAELHRASDSGFFYVKGPELLNKFVGESERNIRKLFEDARSYRARYNAPAIIFIDECDAILSLRVLGMQIHTMTQMTVVPQFLAEMDGLEDSAALIILATNRAEALDPAVVRDGRIDRKVHLSRPREEAAAEIIRKLLDGKPTDGDPHATIVALAVERFFSKSAVLAEVYTDDRREAHDFLLSQVASGAMLTSLVDRLVGYAIDREIERKEESGVSRDDVTRAVDAVLDENRGVNYQEALDEFCRKLDRPIKRVRKLEPGERKSSIILVH